MCHHIFFKFFKFSIAKINISTACRTHYYYYKSSPVEPFAQTNLLPSGAERLNTEKFKNNKLTFKLFNDDATNDWRQKYAKVQYSMQIFRPVSP